MFFEQILLLQPFKINNLINITNRCQDIKIISLISHRTQNINRFGIQYIKFNTKLGYKDEIYVMQENHFLWQIIFLPLKKFEFFYVYGRFVQMYIFEPCVFITHRSWNRALDPLGLELQMVVNHYVDAGNQTRVVWTT